MNIKNFFILLIAININSNFDEDEFIENTYDKNSQIFINKYGYIVNDNQEVLPIYLLLNLKTRHSNNLSENKKIIEDQENIEKWLKKEFEEEYRIFSKIPALNNFKIYPKGNFYIENNNKFFVNKNAILRYPSYSGFFIEKKYKWNFIGNNKERFCIYKNLIKKYENFRNNLISFTRNLNQLKEKIVVINNEKCWYKRYMFFYKVMFRKNHIEKKINICDKKIELIENKIKFLNKKIENLKNLDLKNKN